MDTNEDMVDEPEVKEQTVMNDTEAADEDDDDVMDDKGEAVHISSVPDDSIHIAPASELAADDAADGGSEAVEAKAEEVDAGVTPSEEDNAVEETRQPCSFHLYKLIAAQLKADGFKALSEEMAKQANLSGEEVEDPRCLYQLFRRAQTMKVPIMEDFVDTGLIFDDDDVKLDMPISKQLPPYSTRFVTQHKMTAKCAKFSQDGEYVATGSVDTAIKLLQVSKMHYYSQIKHDSGEDYTQTRPVVRTFYDHSESVTDLDFHPIEPFLVSCSKDCTIKFFDHTKANIRKSYRHIIDTHPVMSINFHPNGDFLLAGTEHPMVRLYDINTFQAYVSNNPKDHHKGPVNQVRYAKQGNVFASASKDGSIKIWDGVENKCINTIADAHAGEEVSSVQFSPSGKYLLSGGLDSVARLWDYSSGKQVMAYAGHRQNQRSPSIFSHCGSFVFSADGDGYIAAWDTKTGEYVKRLAGHSKAVRWLDASPVADEFVSCSEDSKVRFWAANKDT